MKHLGTIQVLAATLALSLKGIWARLAYAEGLDVSGVLFYRSLFSAPLFLFIFALWRKKADSFSSGLRTKDYLPGAALGLLFALGMFFDFEAIAQLGASISRVVLFGFPLIVMVLTGVQRKQWPSWQKIGGFFLAWLGLFAVFDLHSGISLSQVRWALASMATYALYVFLAEPVSRKLGSVRLTTTSNITTAVVVLSVILVMTRAEVPTLPNRSGLWMSLMVLVSTVIPYFLMMDGIRRLGSEGASLLAMVGPVMTVASAWLILGESLSGLQLLGTALTLGGVRLTQITSGRIDSQARRPAS
ncbi:MAG: DMT family transporter [Polyangiaceae bacterium]|nr:DMT family transporter [Polyangiaceae bacterium]